LSDFVGYNKVLRAMMNHWRVSKEYCFKYRMATMVWLNLWVYIKRLHYCTLSS